MGGSCPAPSSLTPSKIEDRSLELDFESERAFSYSAWSWRSSSFLASALSLAFMNPRKMVVILFFT